MESSRSDVVLIVAKGRCVSGAHTSEIPMLVHELLFVVVINSINISIIYGVHK